MNNVLLSLSSVDEELNDLSAMDEPSDQDSIQQQRECTAATGEFTCFTYMLPFHFSVIAAYLITPINLPTTTTITLRN